MVAGIRLKRSRGSGNLNVTVNVVIIDSHPVTRIGLCQLLDKMEDFCPVGTTGDVAEAFDLLQALQPHMLLVATNLGSQIFSLGKRVGSHYPAVKIVIMADRYDEDDRRMAEAMGMRGFLNKNLDLHELEECLVSIALGSTSFKSEIKVPPKNRKTLPTNHPLSPREVDVICHVAQAMTAKEIAKNLHISVKTVDRHKANIMEKLRLRSQIELVRYAIRKGFVEP